MTDEQKHCIIRMRDCGLSFKQIAGKLNLPASTVKSAYQRLQQNMPIHSATMVLTSCPQCGRKVLHTITGRPKRFCSEACRRDWWKAHWKESATRTQQPLLCACCGKAFSGLVGQKRKYCSHTCYIKARFGVETV